MKIMSLVFICLLILVSFDVQAQQTDAVSPVDSRQVVINMSDSAGLPLEGVKVFLGCGGAPQFIRDMKHSNEEGSAEFSMPDGKCLVRLWKGGFVPRMYDFLKMGEAELSFRLYDYRPFSEISYLFEGLNSCVVQVNGQGRVIPSAVVLYTYELKGKPGAGFYAVEELTDAAGEAVLNVPIIPADLSYTLWVYQEGYLPEKSYAICGDDTSAPPKVINLTPLFK